MDVSGIVIDEAKCTACGACVAECPAYVLALADGAASIVGEERCIVCAHCVAVCPEGAVTLGQLPGLGESLDQTLTANPRAVEQLIRSRRSIRSYTDEPVSDDDLGRLLDAARYAPSAHNHQPWQFNVIRGRDQLAALGEAVAGFMESVLHQLSDRQRREALAAVVPPAVFESLQNMAPSFRLIVKSQSAGLDMVFRGAPALIVIHSPRSIGSGVEDAHYAAANVMLLAHAMGLGTCLVGYLVGSARYSPQVAAAARVPPENEIGAALVVGYPRHPYPRIVPRRQPPVQWR